MLSWGEFRLLAETVAEADLEARETQVCPEDVVNIQYTSGTTGFPKGAMLTHRNLLMNAYYVGQRLRFTDRDRLCIPVPFYHCFGCVMGTLMCAIYGAAMVVPCEGFDPLATLEALEKERCTAVYGVPTMFIAELHHQDFAKFELASFAHRRHGRESVSDRSHARRRGSDGCTRVDHRLRPDRGLSRHHSNRG